MKHLESGVLASHGWWHTLRTSLGAVVAVSVLTVAIGGGRASAEPIELTECRLRDSTGLAHIAARCGTLRVPENRSAPDGRQIDLFVAVLPAKSKRSQTDALTFITGGPGQASTNSFVGIASVFSHIRRSRDIVLVDQRGTGKSNPLRCEGISDQQNPWNSPPPEQLPALVRECLEALNADPRHYTTSVAVRDLEAVRRALGYSAFNLYGISYGTRVALHYLRQYPDTTRTVILDGVAPADRTLGPSIASNAQDTLDQLFHLCFLQPECRARFPDLPGTFRALRERLHGVPVSVSVDDPLDGTSRVVEMGERELGLAVRLLSYAPETSSLLPLLIFDAQQTGDLRRFAAQTITASRGLEDSISPGMHNSVVCTEDAPEFGSPESWAELGSTYLGTSLMESLAMTCEIWPRGEIDPDFKTPVVSDTPVLLLSGELDPVTPPANAEHAAKTLSNHLHLIGRGQGHGLAPRGCTGQLMAKFVESGSLTELDTSCIDRLDHAPFFVRLSGPEP